MDFESLKQALASASEADREAMMKEVLFTKPETKEDLSDWIELFLGLKLPDTIVDPESNCTPMEMVWKVYSKAKEGNDPDFSRVLFYAARDAMKTLSASIIVVLMIVLLDRNCAHMAAIKDQSEKALQYIQGFLKRPVIRDLMTADCAQSKSRLEVIDADGNKKYIRIIIASVTGANSEHVPYMSVDELDILRFPQAYEESKFIPAPYKGKLPITVLTSSRKYSFGYVQKEIDQAPTSGLQVFHWNILDVTEKCPASRHLPDQPKINIYHDPEILHAIDEETYSLLHEEQQKKYLQTEGYTGCLKKCKIYASCLGRLATRSPDTSPLLKPIDHVQSIIRSVSPDTARAQYLCHKPSTVGLVYGILDEAIHKKSYAQAAHEMAGEKGQSTAKMSKLNFIEFVKKRIQNGDLKVYGSVDFGDTHNFSFGLAVVDKADRGWFIDSFSVSQMLLEDTMPVVRKLIEQYCPLNQVFIWGDSAMPGHIRSMKRNGFRIKGVEKGPGSVNAGIEDVRRKLRDGTGTPSLFFVFEEDNPMMKLVWDHMRMYHYVLGATGDPTEVPSDESDDECDMARYLVMSVFGKKGRVVTAELSKADMAYFAQRLSPINPNAQPSGPFKNYLQEIMDKVNPEEFAAISERKGSSGGISWNMESDLPPELEQPPQTTLSDIIENVVKSKEDNGDNL